MDKLDELLGMGEKKPLPAELDAAKAAEEEAKKEKQKKAEELKKKEEQLSNLNRAIAEAEAELLKTRKERQKAKSGDDDLPQIDLEDPSVKAWDKHFSGKVSPLQEELEKSRSEIRSVALKEFLSDHLGLAKNPDKVKEVVGIYEKIRTTTESSKEGVLADLKRAYGAAYGDELLELARKRRIDEAKAEEIFAEPAISRGATAYSEEKNPNDSGKTKVSKEQWDFMKHKWGMSDDELNKLYTR